MRACAHIYAHVRAAKTCALFYGGLGTWPDRPDGSPDQTDPTHQTDLADPTDPTCPTHQKDMAISNAKLEMPYADPVKFNDPTRPSDPTRTSDPVLTQPSHMLID